MTDTRSIIIGEYIVALGVSSWAAIKSQQAPWPPTVVKTSIAFALIGMLAIASSELAATLGGGFLLAQLLRVLNKKPPYTGGVPVTGGRDPNSGHRMAEMPTDSPYIAARSILSWKL